MSRKVKKKSYLFGAGMSEARDEGGARAGETKWGECDN